MSMRARFLDVNGLRTRVLESGTGASPLFLLHGVGLTADTWGRNIDALGQQHRVMAIDMPGHGFSDVPSLSVDAPQVVWAHHVLGLADLLNVEKFSIAGSSFSGLVAALVALIAPDRVERLVVVGSGTLFHASESRERALKATFENGRRAFQEPSIEMCRARLQAICYSPSAVDENILLTQATAYALPGRLDAYRATIDGAIASANNTEAHALQRLEELRLPVLIITGRNDIRASVESHEEGRQRIPGAVLKIYSDCGHLPYMEHPIRFNEDVGNFLSAKDLI